MSAYRIDYLELPSPGIAGSRDFFEAAFGWRFTSYGPSYAATGDSGVEMGLDGTEGAVATTLPVIRAEDLDEAESRVVAAGGIITRAQFDFPGGRRFHFREPGGSELAVWVTRE